MKKIMVLALAVSLAATGAGAATAADKPAGTRVVADGKALGSSSGIAVVQGKTFMNYRALLEGLGYRVSFDPQTSTITASADGRELELSVGGDVAFLNGKTVASTGEAIVRNGSTMLGVRFAAKLSGYAVAWEQATRTVRLTYTGPTEAQKAEVYGVFDRLLSIEAAGDARGLAELFSEDTLIDVKQFETLWLASQTKTTIHTKVLESYSDREAVVVIEDETVKISGSFFPDNASRTRYSFHKDSSGQWKIYDIETLDVEYTNIPDLFEQAATVPEADKAAIGKLLEEQVRASNEEDANAYMATLTVTADSEDVKGSLEQLFEASDAVTTVEKAAIVAYNGADKASLLLSMVSEVTASGVKVKVRVVLMNDLEKQGGKWLFVPESVTLQSESL